MDDYDYFGDDYMEDEDGNIWDPRTMFANPGSALRAADQNNPRIFSCPTCYEPNRLTQKDVNLGYQCDACADRAERGFD